MNLRRHERTLVISTTEDQLVALDALMSLSTLDDEKSTDAFPEVSFRPGQGRHRQPPQHAAPLTAASAAVETLSPRLHVMLARHLRRLFSFSMIGVLVLALGILVQWSTVRRLGSNGSYAAQAVFSIELSYVLNRWLTWQDRDARDSWLKWNVQRVTLTVPNWLAYALLVHIGAPWLVANLAVTAVFTVINYITGDAWSFRPAAPAAPAAPVVPTASVGPLPATWLPTVSIVIPCKSNERTIRATVASLLGQDYPNLIELILVGDVRDSTWSALTDIRDSRLVILEHALEPGLRDPNVKRDKGLRKARGDVLALADSDIVMDQGWLAEAVNLLRQQGSGLVAGGMRSIHDSFWGRFVDGNVLAAKTPRLPEPYEVTAARFGQHGYKPPISANAVFMRELYLATPLDTGWFYGYEDYEWFWRVAKAGHKILYSANLTAAHHHRRNYRRLLQEYARSSEGCAQFIRMHRSCPLARKRLTQAITLPLLGVAAVAAAALDVLTGHALIGLAAAATAVALLAVREVARNRRLEAVSYPFIGLSLATAFTVNLTRNLMFPTVPTNRVQTWDDIAEAAPGRHHRMRRRTPWPLALILAVQAALSLSLIWSNTAFTDEADYLWTGHLEWAHWLHGAALPPTLVRYSGSPIIYPPIGALADSLGGLHAARILSLIFMIGATGLLYLVTKRLAGTGAALGAALLWAVSEPTLRLAFATYDPLSVLFFTAAVYISIRVADARHRGELILLAAILLALSNATAYSSIVMAPVAIGIAWIFWTHDLGIKKASSLGAWLAAAWMLLFALMMTLSHSWIGLFDSVLSRNNKYDEDPLYLVMHQAWSFSGIIPVIAASGVVIAFATRNSRRYLFLALGASAFIVPLAQHSTATSLDKHLDYGLWLAAIAAGYVCGWAAKLFPARHNFMAVLSAAVLAVFPVVTGWQAAWQEFHYWPNATSFVSALKPVLASSTGPILIEDGADAANTVAMYYTKQGLDWKRWPQFYTLQLTPNGPASSWPRYYQSRLSSQDDGVIVVFYKTDLSAPDVLPNDMLFAGSSSQSRLLSVVAANTGLRGLPALTKVLEGDKDYRLAAVGPYDGSFADWTYAIWVKR